MRTTALFMAHCTALVLTAAAGAATVISASALLCYFLA
jgi:hypothetical protein